MASADLIILHAHVWTVDDALPEAQAVAVAGERIVYAGSDAGAKALAGPKTRVIDAKGRLLLPGFHDDHTHFVMGGEELGKLDLRDAATPEEFGRRIAAYAKTLPAGAWITGGLWDHSRFPGSELPAAGLIDRFCPDRPVFVNRLDGHMAVANTLALKLAGVTAATGDPYGGTIVRKPGSREPAGVLKDAAMDFVFRAMPKPGPGQTLDALRKAFAEARRLGLTTIHDMVDGEPHLRAYEAARAEGGMTCRVYGRWPIAQWSSLEERVKSRGFGDDLFALRSLKGFTDGSIGSSTAWFLEPYEDDPGHCGLPGPQMTAAEIPAWAAAADRAGLQISLHAIGDRAIRESVGIFDRLARTNGPRDRRPRIEHDQHVHPDDFARQAALGIIASAQPYHAVDDGRFVEPKIGRQRCLSSYPFRTFLDAGVRLCFGSDWWVAPLDPITGIDAAVNRRTLDGKHPEGWYPEQKLSVREAIRCYTIENAYAAFMETKTGSITAGKYADLVLLSLDLLKIPPEEIPEAKVELTMMGGNVVYER